MPVLPTLTLPTQAGELKSTSVFDHHPLPRPESRGRPAEFHRSRIHSGDYEEKKVYNRIFVGGLNETINEDDLRELFGRFGEVKEVQLKDRGAKDETRRGHGFITYKTKEQAALALREGRGEVLEIRGVKLNVCQAIRRIAKQSGRPEPEYSPPPTSRSIYHLASLPGSLSPPGYGYPGMMPLNSYTSAMVNAAYGLPPPPGYWPGFYPPNPLPPTHRPMGYPVSPCGSDGCTHEGCIFASSCRDGRDVYSDVSGDASPEPRHSFGPRYSSSGRPSTFAEMMNGGYINMPDECEPPFDLYRGSNKSYKRCNMKEDNFGISAASRSPMMHPNRFQSLNR